MNARSAVLMLAALAAAPLHAEVLDAAAGGFTARNAVTIAARPEAVWAVLVEPARWWNPAHSWSGDAASFSLEARAGGCFCERLKNGGSVEHQRVLRADPGSLLRLSGGLGPLQEHALAAVLTWELKADGSGTRLSQTYAVAGLVPGGLSGWALPVDGVVREQLERLARVVETGRPDAPPKAQ